jgi:hypothetical protein
MTKSVNVSQCYKSQTAEIRAVLNFGRNMFSFLVGFYAIPLSVQIEIQNAWILWGMLNILFFDVEEREMAAGIGTTEVPQRLVIEITVNLGV